MTESFSVTVRYVCESCGVASPPLRVRPLDSCTEARVPVFHPRQREFDVLTVRMTLDEAIARRGRLETLLADRQYDIEKKMEVIAGKRIRLLQAIRDGFPHPRLKDGVHTLNRQLEACEHDKLRHARLLSGDLGDLVSHISRLRENGVSRYDDGRRPDTILLWPAPWSEGSKVTTLPCVSCDRIMHEEVGGL